MTEAEVEEWLGMKPGELTANKVRLKRAIVDGMKDVPFPAPLSDKAQLFAFRKFLSCGVKPGESTVEPIPEGENDRRD